LAETEFLSSKSNEKRQIGQIKAKRSLIFSENNKTIVTILII
jgi:hypothetical protein